VNFNCLADAVRSFNQKGYNICWTRTNISCESKRYVKNEKEVLLIEDNGTTIEVKSV
jgi:hypothetical protein